MRIGLLGEIEVFDDDDRPVAVTGAKLRALLAVLALHAGRPVAAEQLVDALWGDDPPPASKNGLQALISKLRRALGGADAVAMRGGGYVLDVALDDIDVHRYERLIADARAAVDPAEAAALFGRAELLWRGDVLGEHVYDEFAQATITRLSELRLAALEERLTAQLELGATSGAIPELDALVAEHPLRERLRGLLMLALYRAGRQADALRIYQDGRRILADELGLDPGQELRELEAAILAHDPALDVATPMTSGAATRQPAIPEPLTQLVGRGDELRALSALLDEHRLVTLVGPGGVGKTRLALEAARARAATMAEGGCLVELAPFGDPADVRTAIASALDLPDPTRIVEVIGARSLLLVLDNCEHVIAAAAAVVEDLLLHCAGLRIVATSREGLRVPGEVIWPVPPLASAEALELFVARSLAAGGQPPSTPEALTAIAHICDRLDGLPLAIELAAARTRAFPVEQLASRLQDRFRLLTGGARTALPRQQTLRAVVDWSYDLLFEDEQRVFERLSVFPGGCDLATAQAVCADESLPAADLEDVVYALVEKSLVITVPSDGDLRFAQLQTLAQYGREKLIERGDAERIRNAMAAHLAELCAGSASAFTGDEQRRWLVAMDRERENLRAALEWSADCGDAERALTIAGGASWMHWLSGTLVEGRRWLDAAFAVRGDPTDAARALALTGRGLLAFQSGIREGVDDDLGTALEIFRAAGDATSLAWTYSYWAEVAAARGDVEEGRRRRVELLSFYESAPDGAFVGVARAYSRAKLGQLDDDLVAAEHWYREAAEGLTVIDRPVMRAMCLGMVAEFDERAGRYREAVAALDEAITTCDEVGMRGLMGTMQARLGWALLREGDETRAADAFRAALDHARRLSNRAVTMLSLAGLAVVHRAHGRDAEAAAAATEALELHAAIGPRTMANRISAHADLAAAAAACSDVLAAITAVA